MTGAEATAIVMDDPNRAADPSVLHVPGSFVWWYVDAVDENGDGFVLIWSFGLPFLPGVLSSARAGRPLPARDRPALNVVCYRGGREAFYLLQTYDGSDARWDGGGTFVFGNSEIRIDRSSGRHVIEACLDCEVPRSQHRLRGSIALRGAATSTDREPPVTPLHAWTPLTGPAVVRAELTHGPHRFTHSGLGYHDRNVGRAPLDRLGIARWTWGRVVRPDGVRVHYLVWDEEGRASTAWVVDVDAAGHIRCRAAERVDEHGARTLLYGVTIAERTRLPSNGATLELRAGPIVDQGPFYVRNLFRDEEGHTGVAEHVVPGRIDLAVHRPLVRMRVHATHERGSLWLPLFSGPRQGRWARLVGLEGGGAR